MPAPIVKSDSCYLISSAALATPLSCASFEPTNDSVALATQAGGRNTVWQLTFGTTSAVLRHYYRGGMVARVSKDQFIWSNIEHTRAVKEYRLLEWMFAVGLQVPEPLGARVIKHSFSYRCDLITRFIADSTTLGSQLAKQPPSTELMGTVGQTIKRLHNHNVWHSDLNAHNILVNANGSVHLIDFDRCSIKPDTGWKADNLNRLERSLLKLKSQNTNMHFDKKQWQLLLDGYYL